MKKLMAGFLLGMTLMTSSGAEAAYVVKDPDNIAQAIAIVANGKEILGQVKKELEVETLIKGVQDDIFSRMVQEATGYEKDVLNKVVKPLMEGRKLDYQQLASEVFSEAMNVNSQLDAPLSGIGGQDVIKDLIAGKTDSLANYSSEQVLTKVREAKAKAQEKLMAVLFVTERKRQEYAKQLKELDEKIAEETAKIDDPNTPDKQIKESQHMVSVLNGQKETIHALLTALDGKDKAAEATHKVNMKKIEDAEELARSSTVGKEFKELGEKDAGTSSQKKEDTYKSIDDFFKDL